MYGIEFQLPYIGTVRIKPLIYKAPNPLMKTGESFYMLNKFSLSLAAYKKSLFQEKDSFEVRNNITACTLLLGDKQKAHERFMALKSCNIVSLFNIALASAAINSPKEGIDALRHETNEPVIYLLKGILYYISKDPVNSFKYIRQYLVGSSEKSWNSNKIMQNLKEKQGIVEAEVTFSRGKERLHQAVKLYLENFFSKVTQKPLKFPKSISASNENSERETGDVANVKKRKMKISATMIMKENKVMLRRIINPPQKRVKNLSPICSSPGFKCKDLIEDDYNFN